MRSEPSSGRSVLRTLACVLLVAATMAGACRHAPSMRRVDPATLHPDIRIVQALAIRVGDREMLGRGIVVKSGPRLDVFVLAPTGTRLLTVRQDGLHVESEVRVPELSRLDPDLLLRDIRWAFFSRCPVDPGAEDGQPQANTRQCRIEGAKVTEVLDPTTSRVRNRTFSQGREQVILDLTHAPEASKDAPPARLRLTNERHGYSLDIVVEDWEMLDGM